MKLVKASRIPENIQYEKPYLVEVDGRYFVSYATLYENEVWFDNVKDSICYKLKEIHDLSIIERD